MDLQKFRKKPILGILRGIFHEALNPLLETILESGLETIEFALNGEAALKQIKHAVCYSKGRLMIGAGTVLNLKDLQAALRAGATFIVSPVRVKPVIRYCVKHKIPVFPGSLTPSDIYTAWQEGATMVKVFPASCFGPKYFQELKGPFPRIELLACSGVTSQNMRAYFKNGASAIAIGSSTFRKDWIDSGRFHHIRMKIRTYLNALPDSSCYSHAKQFR